MLVGNLKMQTFITFMALCCHLVSTQNDVRKPPSITEGPKTGKFFRPGESFKLTCRVEGTPEVTIVWKKNGVELNMNQSDIRRRSDGDITIDHANAADNGFYQCFATNKYGTALSSVAHIRMATLAADPQNNPVNNVTVAEGRPFVIRAARLRSLPKPNYVWYIAANNIDPLPRRLFQSRRMQSACNGDLYFAYALKEDEVDGKLYKSTVQNPVTVYSSGGIYTRLTVTNDSGSLPDFPPNITYFSKWQEIALVGGSILLKCFFSGKPLPEITWSRPGSSLPSGRTVLSEFRTELTISGIEVSDAGDYACTAKNPLGTIRQLLNIPVEAVPKFISASNALRNINVSEGESVTFNCSSYAKPEAVVTWFLNGQLIDGENPPSRFEFSSDNRSLTIRNVCRDCDDRETKTDLMVIQCNASNVHGYAFASKYLNFLLKTNVTIIGREKVSVDFLDEKRLMFQCLAYSDPSTTPTVQWYKTEPYGDLVRDEPPYVYVRKEFLIIIFYPNCTSDCAKYIGEYKCIGDNGYSRDDRTIAISYKLGSPTDAEMQNEEPFAVWKIFLGSGSVGLVLFLIGMYFGAKRRVDISTKHSRNRTLPKRPTMRDSVELPSGSIRDHESSLPRPFSAYDQIGYETIDQLLEEMGNIGGAIPHSENSTSVQVYNGYESIGVPDREVEGTGTPMLDENTTYDDMGFPIALENVTNRDRMDQNQEHGYESVRIEVGGMANSNTQIEAINTYTDLKLKEVYFCLNLGQTDACPHLELGSEEMNPSSDMSRADVDDTLFMTSDTTAQTNPCEVDYLVLEN